MEDLPIALETHGKRLQMEPRRITLRKSPARAETRLREAFHGVPTADVVDALGGRGAIDFQIRRLFESQPFVGSALTVETPPNDNLVHYAALEVIGPGDAVVISASDFTGAASIGDTLLKLYSERGVVGVVLDGLVRDLNGIEEIGIPVYPRGLSPNAPQRHGPGRVGTEIVVGGRRRLGIVMASSVCLRGEQKTFWPRQEHRDPPPRQPFANREPCRIGWKLS